MEILPRCCFSPRSSPELQAFSPGAHATATHDVISVMCHLFLKTYSSSQTPSPSKNTWLSTSCPGQETAICLCLIDPPEHGSRGPPRLGSCLSLQPHLFQLTPWHALPGCGHPIAVPGWAKLVLSLFPVSGSPISCASTCSISQSCPSPAQPYLLLSSNLNVTPFENSSLDQIKSSCWHPYFPQT